jgi:hypothetical protein
MDRLEAISVNLTTEEMVVLLDQLGTAGYAGLDTSSLDQLSERERSLALDVARRGLIARQHLTRDGAGEWQVGQFALAALGISLSPSQSVMVIRGQSQDTAVSYLFHTAQDVFTTHEVIEHTIHRFLVLRDGPTWQEAVLSAAGLAAADSSDTAPQVPPALVRQSLLNDAYAEAQTGTPAKAEAMLVQAGVNEATAQSLAAALTEPVTFATIIAITHTPEERRRDLTLLTGANGCWRLESQNGTGDDGQLGVAPLSAAHARQQIIELIS